MITNGYCTLAELKQRLLEQRTYSAATLSFDAETKVITDSARGLKRFSAGMHLQISGSVSNDGYFTVATGDNPANLVVSETLIDEAVGEMISITDVSDQADDVDLERAIEAVSREIDHDARRRFFTTAEDEVRYYTSEDGQALFTEDILSITELATDVAGNRTYTTVWASSDYDKLPDNANLNGKPYTYLMTTPNGRYGFATTRRGNRITGRFGYSATTPAVVNQACLIQASRLFKRKDSPFGVMGSPETGYVRLKDELDPDVKKLLNGVRRPLL